MVQWIDVHERLPGVGVKSLFVIRGRVVADEIGISDNGYRIYDNSEFDTTPLIYEITHWAPWPEPPPDLKNDLCTCGFENLYQHI